MRPAVRLEYESFGSPADPTIVLVAGFGAQLLTWAEGFCQRLAAGGRRVVRFDNRDCGLSTKLDEHPLDFGAVLGAASSGDLAKVRALAPYTLHDMADDVAGLLDTLGVERAHVVGSSMGGMIAQLVAVRHPARVATLTSMMSSTGEPEYGRSTPEASAGLMRPSPTDRAGFVERQVESARIWSSRKHFDAEAAAAMAEASFERGFHPAGVARQLAALIATEPPVDALRKLDLPTLVIHGLDDTLITPSGGERTAELIPGARLLRVDDMGHDRPEPLWPQLCDAILAHTA